MEPAWEASLKRHAFCYTVLELWDTEIGFSFVPLSGNSNTDFLENYFSKTTRNSHPEVFCKKLFLEMSQNSIHSNI